MCSKGEHGPLLPAVATSLTLEVGTQITHRVTDDKAEEEQRHNQGENVHQFHAS